MTLPQQISILMLEDNPLDPQLTCAALHGFSALSDYGMEHDIQRSQPAGFIARLTKPVNLNKLQSAFTQALSS